MQVLEVFESKSPQETEEIARELSGRFKKNDVILLEGDLGSGKTFLVKALCRIWQTEDEAVSPSFAIIHHYRGNIPVNHFDFYRIHSETELDQLGWEEMLIAGAVTFIEWPQLLEKHLAAYYKISIAIKGDKRRFKLQKFG